MSSDQPPPGSPDDPFAKRPPEGGGWGRPEGSSEGPPPGGDQPPPSDGAYGGGPHGAPPPGRGGPYGQSPYGGAPGGADPLAGMPPLADSGKRLLARIIDIVIVLIPAFLLDWAAVGIQEGDFTAGRSAVGGVFTAGIGFLYEFLMTRATGQTVGKKVMRLRTAMLADGRVPTSNASAARAAILWLPAFCCSCVWFLVIGVTVAVDRPYRQGIHDKAARTVVVQAD